ncbi:MAG: hypothetical protein K0Q71_4849, partial [Thermomicrobiales bacterium]|nr:hypothetical protein [Thermomicrobiales bacterium]
MLAQVVLALLLVHTGLRFGLDLLPKVEHVQTLLNEDAQATETIDWIEDLEQFLALVRRKFRREGDQVGQPARLFDPAHHRQHLFRHVGKHADVVLDLLHHRGHRRFRFRGRIDRVILADDTRDEIRILLHQLGDDAAGKSLQDNVAAAARPKLCDLGDDTDAAQLVFLRLGFRIGDPLRLTVDSVVSGRFADGVGQQRAQLTLFVGDAIGRAGVR